MAAQSNGSLPRGAMKRTEGARLVAERLAAMPTSHLSLEKVVSGGVPWELGILHIVLGLA
jgi:hypothetical protein